LSGGDYESDVTHMSYRKAVMTLCSSNVFLLSELGELLREMKRRGVSIDLSNGVTSRNASTGQEYHSRDESEKIIEANLYDCRLWDLAQVLVTPLVE